jgi:hypothetical protein
LTFIASLRFLQALLQNGFQSNPRSKLMSRFEDGEIADRPVAVRRVANTQRGQRTHSCTQPRCPAQQAVRYAIKEMGANLRHTLGMNAPFLKTSLLSDRARAGSLAKQVFLQPR